MASKNQRSFGKNEDAPTIKDPHVVVRQDDFSVLKYPAAAGAKLMGSSSEHAAMLAGHVPGAPQYIAVPLATHLDAVSALAAV